MKRMAPESCIPFVCIGNVGLATIHNYVYLYFVLTQLELVHTSIVTVAWTLDLWIRGARFKVTRIGLHGSKRREVIGAGARI